MLRHLAVITGAVLSFACASAPKPAARPADPPTVVEAPPQPKPAPKLMYRAKVPGTGWTAKHNVPTQPGGPVAKLVFYNKDLQATILVFNISLIVALPEDFAENSRKQDEAGGLVTTEVACEPGKPAPLCSYRVSGLLQGKPVSGKLTAKLTLKAEEFVSVLGFWPPESESRALEEYEALVGSIEVVEVQP
jgi:hypothetical protein